MNKQEFIDEIAKRGAIDLSKISRDDTLPETWSYNDFYNYLLYQDDYIVRIYGMNFRNPPTRVEDIRFYDAKIHGYVEEMDTTYLLARISELPFEGARTHTFNLIADDNYISLPYLPLDATPDIFGSGVVVLEYNPTTAVWKDPSNLLCNKGYYLYSSNAKRVTITGTECVVSVADLIAVYNRLSVGQLALVGVGNADINVVGTVLEGKVKGYNPNTKEFESVNLLKVGEGYWLERIEEEKVKITFVVNAPAKLYVDGDFKGTLK